MKADRQGFLASRSQQQNAQLAERLADCWLLDTCRVLLLIIAAVASVSRGVCQSSGEQKAFSCACSCSIVGPPHCYAPRVYVCPCILSLTIVFAVPLSA